LALSFNENDQSPAHHGSWPWWAALWLMLLSTVALAQSPTEWHYFGDTLSERVDEETHHAISKGATLFATSWRGAPSRSDNRPSSCVSCHEVPMPGGSGITRHTLVVARPDDRSFTGFHLEGRRGTASEKLEIGTMLLRTPPLFGIAIAESAVCSAGQLHSDQDCRTGGLGYRGKIRSIEDFVAFAFEKELGVEVVLSKDGGDTARITRQEIGAVATYLRHLAPPPRFASKDPAALDRGEHLFSKLGCDTCHSAPTEVLSLGPTWLGLRQFPYTDYRQHRIHERYAYSVRTAALWGSSYVGPPYFHDGSATSLEEAILKHELEASFSSGAYRNLSDSERADIIIFLKSL
jgi:hypothetical protein